LLSDDCSSSAKSSITSSTSRISATSPSSIRGTDTIEFEGRSYVVQTTPTVIAPCLLMTTDPGDLVLDPTCGSGTTAYVAEQWGRRWITCDTSRVALTLAKQRLLTAGFDYYELAKPAEGVGSGFRYRTVPHVTLKSIANNPEIREGMSRAGIDAAIAKYAEEETLYDQPFVDKRKRRVTGPFTVEAVPAPVVAAAARGRSRRPRCWAARRQHRPLGHHGAVAGVAGRAAQDRGARQGRTENRVHPGRGPRRPRLAARRRRDQAYERRQTRARRGLLRPRARPPRSAPGGDGDRGGPNPGPAPGAGALRRLPDGSGGDERHSRDALARRGAARGADEHRSAHRRPQKDAQQQPELLAHRPARCRGEARRRQIPGRGARLRLLRHPHRRDRVGRHRQDRALDARPRLRRPQPIPPAGVFPHGR